MQYLEPMNFLGHAYLSFGHPEILVGNMISDFVKGKTQYQYPEDIQKGIKLHRLIDDYTDRHPATLAAKEFFRPAYRLYSAPIVDVVYDHFLASDEQTLTDQELSELAQNTYNILDQFHYLLPSPLVAMLPYMKRDNWLYNYKSEQGIYRSLQGLMRRASITDDGSKALAVLLANKADLGIQYRHMIADVKHFAKGAFEELIDPAKSLPNN
ncbi:Acyl carrier protein phosphodiesterase [Cnuella takakiae]|uniref:Acyl carrier protein phosphodiesterase n=2 Tax=Cnuella takakiae TaxID=1302690 RepID=A0A1M5D659_9BACT|nr:Acyl carrier protein phosphodiesterase [Cnuella takakiae]